jgi:adenosine kinase
MSYNIAVIGPIPRDLITTYKGEVFEKYGCVTHPVIALSKLLDGNGTVYPVCHLEKKDEQPVKDLLSAYPSVDVSGITCEANRGDVIQLTFVDANVRNEKQTGLMDPIMPKDMEPFLHCDVFVFIPITDYEVPAQTLEYVKKNSDGLIIFDAHGPTNMVNIQGERLVRFWMDRDLWLPYIDVLKMNREEAFCSYPEAVMEGKVDEEHPEASEEVMDLLAEHCLSHGTKAVCITMDSRGCMVYTKEGGKEMVPAYKVGPVVDTTGCGDSFAGGLAFGYLHYKDFYKGTRYANLLGALRTQGSTFEVFKSFEESSELIRQQYEL